jgi:hypothetical protein
MFNSTLGIDIELSKLHGVSMDNVTQEQRSAYERELHEAERDNNPSAAEQVTRARNTIRENTTAIIALALQERRKQAAVA